MKLRMTDKEGIEATAALALWFEQQEISSVSAVTIMCALIATIIRTNPNGDKEWRKESVEIVNQMISDVVGD